MSRRRSRNIWVITDIFGEQIVPQKETQNSIEKVQNPSKRDKSGFLPWRVFLTQCCCATFGSMGVRNQFSIARSFRNQPFDLQAHPKSQRVICLINMRQPKRLKWLDIHTHTYTRHTRTYIHTLTETHTYTHTHEHTHTHTQLFM